MKQYIVSCIQRLKSYSKQLDGETILYNKKWWIFNDVGEAEVFIFRPNNDLLLSRNGVVTKGKWTLNGADATLLVEFDKISYLYQPAFIDNNLLAFNLYGTKENIIMIDEQNKDNFQPRTLNELNKYFEDKEKLLLEEKRKLEQLLLGQKLEDEKNQKKVLLEQKRNSYVYHNPEYIKIEEYIDNKDGLLLVVCFLVFVVPLIAVAIVANNGIKPELKIPIISAAGVILILLIYLIIRTVKKISEKKRELKDLEKKLSAEFDRKNNLH
ncbi:MAG: hypothetical protein LBT56_04175 [Prevotellaceae bacterium]|jgi:hypothetical protein|nr:hypothetical protein [Prevotellaceae bacterium]